MIAKVARKGIGHTRHHWARCINDELCRIQVPIRQAAKRHGISVSCGALNGALHPYHTACVNVGFQRRYGRSVRREEVSQEVIVPVENNHPIIAEHEASQLCRRKHRVSVPGAGDSGLHHRAAPWIVRLE